MSENPSRRRSRSHSPRPSPPRRRDYVTVSSSLDPNDASPALSSRPPSRFAVLERRKNAAVNTASPSVPGRYTDLQPSSGHHFFDRTPNKPDSQQPRPFNQFGIGASDLIRMTTQPSCINSGIFSQAHDFTVTGTFVDASSVTYNQTSSNRFMKEFLEETIRGAEFDSSDRDPPPRCQPGTRLAILQRCLSFISNCDGVKKMRWVVGVAGVGKSAIMQSVAESPELTVGSPTSVFFSINGRNNGSKAITTLSYQFAAKSDSYRQVIEQEITRDPSLLRSSITKQFSKLIVEPFIHNPQLKSTGRVLVIIDGLDECKDHRTQLELLRLISDLCLTYPSSPLVWLIASRPEPHITSFFSRPNVVPAYEMEEIPVDSDEARTDVERFLRDKLTEIKEESGSLDPRWPEERDFWKVANAAGGLFAYAETVIRYVGDSRIGSPVSQFSDVLYVIDKRPMAGASREEHPMALLDALYERILSNVAPKIMINTRKLLLGLASGWDSSGDSIHITRNIIVLCNWLGMTADEFYAAVNHLRSVLYVPQRHQSYKGRLRAFHKSFIDYISDYIRSGFSSDIRDEGRRLAAQCTFRILTEVPDGIKLDFHEHGNDHGRLAGGPMTRDRISLSWSVAEASGWNDNKTWLSLYHLAIGKIIEGMLDEDPNFQSEVCIRFLTTVFEYYSSLDLHKKLMKLVFDESRRHEFMGCGMLKQIPLEAVALHGLYDSTAIKLQFCRPVAVVANLSDPWVSSCQHKCKDKGEAGKVHGWTTTFHGMNHGRTVRDRGGMSVSSCTFCFERLKYQLRNWKAQSPDDAALVLFTSTGSCGVQVRLVDPEDDISEWKYSFWCDIPREAREKYGSSV